MSKSAAAAIELLLAILQSAGPVSAAIRRAQVEGRTLSREELEAAFAQDDIARDALVGAIDKAT